VDLQTFRIFSVMGVTKKTPLILKIFIFLIVIGLIIVLIRFINSRLLKQRAQADYDEYLRKAKGL
jgi:tetrahydromethanopterin S-methyltransferase subunit E